MQPIDDTTPEEMKSENEQVVAFLRTLYRRSAIASPTEQEQARERIRARLAAADMTELNHKDPGARPIPVQRLLREWDQPGRREPDHAKQRFSRHFALVAAVLIVGVIVGSMAVVLNLARHRQGTTEVGFSLASRVYLSGGGIASLDGKTGKILWSYSESIGSPMKRNISFSMPAATNESVYTIAETGELYAFDAQNGALRWKRSLDGNLGANQPVISDGILYVGAVDPSLSRNAYVYALNPSDGSTYKRYSVTTTDAGYKEDMIHWTIADGIIYITTSNNLYALNLSTGAQIWHRQERITQKFYATHVIGGVVYAPTWAMFVEGQPNESDNGYVHAYNASTGAAIWTSDKIEAAVDSQSTVAGDAIYLYSVSAITAVNIHTGKILWTRLVDGATGHGPEIIIYNVPPLVENNIVYFNETYTNFKAVRGVALNAKDGSNHWQKPLDDFQILRVQDGVIYAYRSVDITSKQHGTPVVSQQEQHIVALRASDRSQIWETALGKPSGFPISPLYGNEAVAVP